MNGWIYQRFNVVCEKEQENDGNDFLAYDLLASCLKTKMKEKEGKKGERES